MRRFDSPAELPRCRGLGECAPQPHLALAQSDFSCDTSPDDNLLSLILNEPAHFPRCACVVAHAILIPVLDEDQVFERDQRWMLILCSRFVYTNHDLSTQKTFLPKKPSTCAAICMALTHPFGPKNLLAKRIALVSFAGHEGVIKRRYVLIGRKRLFPRFHWAYRVSEENLARLPATCYL